MGGIKSKQFKIREAFKDNYYQIPDYQRKYVWKKKHVEQFLNDIKEQKENNKQLEYFIGTILVTPIDKNNFKVIDGQQRFTTIFLILCVLRVLFEEMKKEKEINKINKLLYNSQKKLRLKLNYEKTEELIKTIIEINRDPKAVEGAIKKNNPKIYKDTAVKNIRKAYEIIYKFLNSSNEGERKEYWDYLREKVVFTRTSVPKTIEAMTIFEAINERGVGLNPMDLLKTLLFIQIKDKEDKLPDLKEKWKEITDKLEENKHVDAHSSFLRYFLMANFDTSKILAKKDTYDWLKDSQEETEYKTETLDFVEKIKKNVDHCIHFKDGKNHYGESSHVMHSLNLLTKNNVHQHDILLLAAARFPKELFETFAFHLEELLFYHIFTESRGNELESKIVKWAKKVRKTAKEEGVSKADKLNKGLIKDEEKGFAGFIDKKKLDLDRKLKHLKLNKSNKNQIKYLLAYLTEQVEMGFNGENVDIDRKEILKDGRLKKYEDLDIEHILPLTPEDKETTKSLWEEKNEENYDEYAERLGNLTLLGRKINSTIGNEDFAKKKKGYAESPYYLTQSLAGLKDRDKTDNPLDHINEYLHEPSSDEWTAKDIDKRQEKLIDLVKKIWKIQE